MTKVHCLSSREVGLFLAHLVDARCSLEEYMARSLEAARCWELRIVCYSVFIARHLGTDAGDMEKIERVYAANGEMDIHLQEGGDDFVEYLLRNIRAPGETLDDALIAIQEGLSGFDYEKTLRY